jgi:transcriptional regulator with XRE-family HTH domain
MKETLKLLRERNNYSQAGLASYLGISRQTYIRYEKGEIVPSLDIISRLCKFYRIPYDVLIENKLNSPDIQEKKSLSYKIENTEGLELHENTSINEDYGEGISIYLNSIFSMLPKLIYTEQLKLLEKLSSMVLTSTQEKILPVRKTDSLEQLLSLTDSLHLNSGNRKWTRAELYDR